MTAPRPSTGHATPAPDTSHARQVADHLALCGDADHTVAESRWWEQQEARDRAEDWGGAAA